MSNAILAFAEQRDGQFRKTAGEVVSAAADLAEKGQQEVVALVIGSGVEGLAGELGRYGAARVLVYDAEQLKDYTGMNYAAAVFDAVQKVDPSAVLFSASKMGKDLAPRVAAKAGASVASDCVEMKLEDGTITARRPIFAGKAYAWTVSSGTFIATLRPNVFPAKEKDGTAALEKVDFSPAADEPKITLKEVIKAAGKKAELTESEIIVSGGRGMKGPENFNIIEELAQALNAAVGASRAVVDAGWREHADQVGQTGKTVTPNLYIACGISGAIQHLAGMSSSKVIVAINKDPEAPIFKLADYGIVGDVFEVVPALTEEIKKSV
jgi:electron transfer flavoprotein alpha subunit